MMCRQMQEVERMCNDDVEMDHDGIGYKKRTKNVYTLKLSLYQTVVYHYTRVTVMISHMVVCIVS